MISTISGNKLLNLLEYIFPFHLLFCGSCALALRSREMSRSKIFYSITVHTEILSIRLEKIVMLAVKLFCGTVNTKLRRFLKGGMTKCQKSAACRRVLEYGFLEKFENQNLGNVTSCDLGVGF